MTGVVYSTQHGRTCPGCGRPKAQCACKTSSAPQGDGPVRLTRSTKGRRGKTVTVITGVPLAADELKKLAQTLKQHCGTGGTVKDGVIEIQGDHRDRLMALLKQQGFKVK